MAPSRRPRDSNPRSKPRRRQRSETDPLSSCLGKLCGEECEQPVRQPGRRGERRHDAMDDVELDELDEAMSDEEYSGQRLPLAPPSSSQRAGPAAKAGRVIKPKQKKPAASSRVAEMPLSVGLQKAKRYFTEALEFGITAGYVTPKDREGKMFQLAPELVRSMDMRSRVGGGSHSCSGHGELRDGDGQVGERRSRRRSSGRGKKRKHRSMRSKRSRSRSKGRKTKRRHGRRHGTDGNSRQMNVDGEGRSKEGAPEAEQEQDDMDERSKAQVGETSQERGDEHEETKSIKSTKSQQQKSESQAAADERNKNASPDDEDEDAYENDGSEDEDEKKN